ncbi:MAG: hypothetical protein KC912_16555 [Proteobacteria bacterium]|nr:hypothetical protein [Pseudomonadota bacterium]
MSALVWLALALAGEPLDVHVSGYVDVGAFATTGDGVSYRWDPAGEVTGHANETWAFWGDPWASTVNSRGDVADLGADRNNLERYDPIASGGRPTFLVNTANVSVAAARDAQVTGAISLDLMPRSGSLGAPGDSVAVDLAYLDLLPSKNANWRIYLGKFTPVFGREYRERTAAQRFGITPSLIGRYTTGTPTGVKVRGSLLGRSLWFAASATNGSATTERFGHFSDEIDRNAGKTGSARVAVQTRGRVRVETGGSAQVGSVDDQPDASLVGWQTGLDLGLLIDELEIVTEFVWVRHPGVDLSGDFVRARGGYMEFRYTATPWMGGLLRFDWRDATMRIEHNFYDSNVGRVVGGLRFVPRPDLTVKVEYLGVIELEGPAIPDDVFTTSCVFTF